MFSPATPSNTHAAAAHRVPGNKPPRTALAPVESNTSSFADYTTPTDCRARSFTVDTSAPYMTPGIYPGDSTTVATAPSPYTPFASVQYYRPRRYRHDVYGMAPYIEDSNWVFAPTWRASYRWCGPRAVPVRDPEEAEESPAVPAVPAALAAPAAPATQATRAATAAIAVPAAPSAPAPTAPQLVGAAADPRNAATRPPRRGYAAALTANLDISSISSTPSSAPQNEYYRSHGVPSRAGHDTSLSSDVSEPSLRPRPDGRRVLAAEYVATVGFRFRVDRFLVAPSLASRCLPGSVVVVQGDRGEDAGTIRTVATLNRDAGHVPERWVVRMAAVAETAKLRELTVQTDAAKTRVAAAIREWASRGPEVRRSVKLVEVEFQFDSGKLFVHYEAAERVAFKDLAGKLFQDFRCRVWLNQLNYHESANARR